MGGVEIYCLLTVKNNNFAPEIGCCLAKDNHMTRKEARCCCESYELILQIIENDKRLATLRALP